MDLPASHLCGYLNIRGLTEDWPELTTYFDAEIIGSRYGFVTGKWGASEADDLKHWVSDLSLEDATLDYLLMSLLPVRSISQARFAPFRPLRNHLAKPGLRFNHMNKPFIFMRWKERFLVPDHRVRDINGASFAGKSSSSVAEVEGGRSGTERCQSAVALAYMRGQCPSLRKAGRLASMEWLNMTPDRYDTSLLCLHSRAGFYYVCVELGNPSSDASLPAGRMRSPSSPTTSPRPRRRGSSSQGVSVDVLMGDTPSSTTMGTENAGSSSSTFGGSSSFGEGRALAEEMGNVGRMSGFYFHENSEP